ncbi:hypothetical protein ACFWD7_06190 [Streptomyces mirabilis]|uniref:hypothetical protein n=1 Tax=Streptomyces mirabilis TaxID=68239 RepID=UPI00368EAD4E
MTFPDVQGRCPACNGASLFLADGGYITCRRLDCPQPDAATEVIAGFWEARQHGAFTFCEQNVGHVTMPEFAKKITEKVTAVAHRKEAVEYASEQKERADQAEKLLRIAHDTSNKAEAALARVRRLCELTITTSVRVQAVQQARDTLAALDGKGQP